MIYPQNCRVLDESDACQFKASVTSDPTVRHADAALKVLSTNGKPEEPIALQSSNGFKDKTAPASGRSD